MAISTWITSKAGEVMIPEQWGQGPVVGGRLPGILILPSQCVQQNSLCPLEFTMSAMIESCPRSKVRKSKPVCQIPAGKLQDAAGTVDRTESKTSRHR